MASAQIRRRLNVVSKLLAPDSPLVASLHPSPNCGERLNGAKPAILLMHYTGMSSARKAISWLADPKSGVSCHYVVDETGTITQMVSEQARAWHAGRSFWQGETDINSCSIGIEIQNPGHQDGYQDFPAAQMAAVLALSQDILARHGILNQRVLAHSDIAPTRKIDPGEKFDWRYLADNGVGHWVSPQPIDRCDLGLEKGLKAPEVLKMQKLLEQYGFGVETTGVLDDKTALVVRAFQLHFRPQRIDGRIDESSVRTLERLIETL